MDLRWIELVLKNFCSNLCGVEKNTFKKQLVEKLEKVEAYQFWSRSSNISMRSRNNKEAKKRSRTK